MAQELPKKALFYKKEEKVKKVILVLILNSLLLSSAWSVNTKIYPNPAVLMTNISKAGPASTQAIYNYLKQQCTPKNSKLFKDICIFPTLLDAWKKNLNYISNADSIRTIEDTDITSIYLKAGLWQTERFLEPGEIGGFELVYNTILLEIALRKSLEQFSSYLQDSLAPHLHMSFIISIYPLVNSYLFQSSTLHSLITFYNSINCPFRSNYCDTYKAAVARMVIETKNNNSDLIPQLTTGLEKLSTLPETEENLRAKQIVLLIDHIEVIYQSDLTPTSIRSSLQNSQEPNNELLLGLHKKIKELSYFYLDFYDESLLKFYLEIAKLSEIKKINKMNQVLAVDVEWETNYSTEQVSKPEFKLMVSKVKKELIQAKRSLKLYLNNEVPK